MIKRTLIRDLELQIGKRVLVKGWISVRRDQGKMIFFDIRDRSSSIQAVVLPSSAAMEQAKTVTVESPVELQAIVNKRPERNVNHEVPNGKIELEIFDLQILAKAETLPFDMSPQGYNLDLVTELNHRALTLRHKKNQAIFKVQSVIIDAFREFMKQEEFFEFQAPSIAPAVAEGGAEVFEIQYFDKKAYLSQSPQLYKQIVMTAFERVFSVNKIFRAEPSATTRHLTEVVSLDAEMSFIDSWVDVRDMSEATVRYILDQVNQKCSQELKYLGAEIPVMIEKTPTLSLREAQQKISLYTNKEQSVDKDLNPEEERLICQIIKEETTSDFVYIYGYPTRDKPFYVYPNPQDPSFNEGMDLLCRGVEWLSGGRRINDYQQLQNHIAQWGMDPDKLTLFLEAFRYGAPPEGGFAFGAERMTMQILGLANIREASMFPRDLTRIDTPLSEQE